MTVAGGPRAASPVRRRSWTPRRRGGGVAVGMGSVRTRVRPAGRGTITDVPTVTSGDAGAVHPIRRAVIVDVEGTARMLDRLLGHRPPGPTPGDSPSGTATGAPTPRPLTDGSTPGSAGGGFPPGPTGANPAPGSVDNPVSGPPGSPAGGPPAESSAGDLPPGSGLRPRPG